MSKIDKSYLEYLEERIRFRLKVEKTIGDISTYLVFSSNFEMSIQYFLSEIADLFRIYMVDGVLVNLFDEPVNDQILVLSWNSDRVKNRGMDFARFPVENLSWLVKEIQEGHEIFLSTNYDFPPDANNEKAFLEDNKIESLIAFPIFTPEYIAGALIIINIDNTINWPEEDLRTLRLFADILGTAIFRKKTEETLSKSRDYLKSQVKRKTKDLATEKQRVELILNTIKDGIIVLDEDGKVIIANSTAKDIYEQIFNKSLSMGMNLVLSTEHIFFSTIRELFLSKRTKEITIEPCKGLYLQFVSAKSGFASLGTIIEMRDITPFVEFDNMRKRFVSTVSHELRTPITVISQSISNYERYGAKLPESTKQRLFEAISRNANLLKELIEDLLLISRIDERRLKFHWQEFEVLDVLNEVI
ncbi:MAG: histidine kinase dimerization/phospho-acceptor domain-containing protein, partial [Candidatus Hodarchaeales archaeon]